MNILNPILKDAEFKQKTERTYTHKYKRKKHSPVWKFSKKHGDFAICNFCDKKIAGFGSKGFSTSNVLAHLKRHHKEEIGNEMENVESERNAIHFD